MADRSPLTNSTTVILFYAPLVEWKTHMAKDHDIPGSTPGWGTNIMALWRRLVIARMTEDHKASVRLGSGPLLAKMVFAARINIKRNIVLCISANIVEKSLRVKQN